MNTDPRFKAATENDEERECRRRRPMNAEGCKPETDILLSSAPCAGAKLCRSLDKAEGCKSDIKSSIHPDDMAAITKWHGEFLRLTDYGWPDDASLLQDQAYALGRTRGQDDWLDEQRQVTAALREDLERGNRIQLAMAMDLSAIAQELGIPPDQQQGGAPESLAAVKALRTQQDERAALLRDCFTAMLKGGYSKPLRERIKAALGCKP